MRLSLLLLAAAPLSLLGGCTDTCNQIGSYIGDYLGDAEGTLEVEVSEAADDSGTATVDVSLSEPLSALGTVSLACDSEEFSIELTNTDGDIVGEFEGALEELAGDGTWSTLDGLAGTWSMTAQ